MILKKISHCSHCSLCSHCNHCIHCSHCSHCSNCSANNKNQKVSEWQGHLLSCPHDHFLLVMISEPWQWTEVTFLAICALKKTSTLFPSFYPRNSIMINGSVDVADFLRRKIKMREWFPESLSQVSNYILPKSKIILWRKNNSPFKKVIMGIWNKWYSLKENYNIRSKKIIKFIRRKR